MGRTAVLTGAARPWKRAAELRTVADLVTEQQQQFLEAWNEFFRGRG
jgi:hypothetical protein